MNKSKIEVYRFYKNQYPGAVILFHINHDYVAFEEDAETANLLFKNHNIVGEWKIPDSQLCNYLIRFGESGVAVKVIDYRDQNGNFNLPDVEKLNQEKNEDY